MLWIFITEKRYKNECCLYIIYIYLFSTHMKRHLRQLRSRSCCCCFFGANTAIDILYNRIKWLTAIWNDAAKREWKTEREKNGSTEQAEAEQQQQQ